MLVMEDEEEFFTICAFGSIGLNSAQMQPYPKFQEFLETELSQLLDLNFFQIELLNCK